MAEQRNDAQPAQTALDVLAKIAAELEKSISAKDKQIEEYKILLKIHGLDDVSDKHKGKLFRFIFGSHENKRWTLSLYNAINKTNYTNIDDLSFNTIRDAMYMRMKNDISFIISSEMNLWEHQSTFNPNMPMRFFVYGGRLYESIS